MSVVVVDNSCESRTSAAETLVTFLLRVHSIWFVKDLHTLGDLNNNLPDDTRLNQLPTGCGSSLATRGYV